MWAKREVQESHLMFSRIQESVNLHVPRRVPILGVRVSVDFHIFKKTITKVKIHWIEKFLTSLESSKMGSYNSFEHLKHKLWPKKGSRVKLVI